MFVTSKFAFLKIFCANLCTKYFSRGENLFYLFILPCHGVEVSGNGHLFTSDIVLEP